MVKDLEAPSAKDDQPRWAVVASRSVERRDCSRTCDER